MLVLFEHPLSPYAQKNKIALREKGVEFQSRLPAGVGAGTGYDSSFSRASPRAEVPALVHKDANGEEVEIFDSTIILEYIEDAFPEPPLLPASAAGRARARMIEDVMDTHYEAINWALSEIRNFKRAEGELADRLEAAARDQTRRMHEWLEGELGNRSWFGDDGSRSESGGFGWADLSVLPYVAASVGMGLAPKKESTLSRWLLRAMERPSVESTLSEAGAAAAAMSQVADLVSSGQFKRQYRDHRLEWMIRNGGIEIVTRGLDDENIRFTDFP